MPFSSAPAASQSALVVSNATLGAVAKRSLDIAVTVLVLLVFAPLFAVLWAAVRLSSPGPVLFVQQRVGKNGQLFWAYKFRTMVVDAEERLALHLAQDPVAREEYATYRKLRRDPRVTSIGRLLRRYSLDELPQLLNVLKGEMSLIGPRCYLPQELRDMGAKQSVILSVLPGLTGLWQVSGRNGTTFAQRLEIDARYVLGWSLRLDLAILARTVWVVLAARNAY